MLPCFTGNLHLLRIAIRTWGALIIKLESVTPSATGAAKVQNKQEALLLRELEWRRKNGQLHVCLNRGTWFIIIIILSRRCSLYLRGKMLHLVTADLVYTNSCSYGSHFALHIVGVIPFIP